MVRTFEDPDGGLAIVMELVGGKPLAVSITIGVLDALDYLHDQGLARFDLKPSSILLTEARTPVISDVALA